MLANKGDIMNDMLEYNGYHAKIEFSTEDRLFVGEVFDITDSLNFHASSVDGLTQAFHDCIHEYLQVCSEIGKSPDKAGNGPFNVRVL